MENGDSPYAAQKENLMLTLRSHREYRDALSCWLAVEVLINDAVVLEDDVLASHLGLLLEKLEAEVRGAV